MARVGYCKHDWYIRSSPCKECAIEGEESQKIKEEDESRIRRIVREEINKLFPELAKKGEPK